MKKRLYECAKMLHPKNSRPFEITLDCPFGGEQICRRIKESGIISRTLVAELYRIPEDLITNIMFFDPALGFKTTSTRRALSGVSFDRDIYGAQQYTLLVELLVEV